MNLLLVNYEYPPIGGGAATATRAIAHALSRQGCGVHVLTARFGCMAGTQDEDGVLVHRIPALRKRAESASVAEMVSFAASALLQMRIVSRRYQIGGIVAFFSIPCGPIAWISGRPYVVSLRGGDVPGTESSLNLVHTLLSPFRRRVLRDAIAIVANSEGLRLMSEAVDPVPVRVIPNGVDTTIFRPIGPAANRGPLRLLFVGRFQAQKNLAWLIRQIAAAKAPIRLTFVGDGPLRANLQAEAAYLGIGERVEWQGWRPREELAAMYPCHDVLVNPSHYEGMPNVVLEAMACGLPVLASRVAGNDTLVRDGVNGFLFPLGDDGAFATALSRLVSADCRVLLGREARRTAESHSWIEVARAYAALFVRG